MYKSHCSFITGVGWDLIHRVKTVSKAQEPESESGGTGPQIWEVSPCNHFHETFGCDRQGANHLRFDARPTEFDGLELNLKICWDRNGVFWTVGTFGISRPRSAEVLYQVKAVLDSLCHYVCQDAVRHPVDGWQKLLTVAKKFIHSPRKGCSSVGSVVLQIFRLLQPCSSSSLPSLHVVFSREGLWERRRTPGDLWFTS